MTPHITYIHGANATPKSFTMIRKALPSHSHTNIIYSASDRLQDIINATIKYVDQPTHVVSHSMGGIIGVAMSHLRPDLFKTVTTISTPFGGSEAADKLLMMMPYNTFLRNIQTSNPILREIIAVGPTVPTMNIITTQGSHAFETKQNDGVVTVESQKAFSGLHVEVPYDHFEVLQDEEVAMAIGSFIFTKI
jgi:pimeloyl-ACP methyl ester carboxylesterase